MTDFSAQNAALTLRIKHNIFTSMESPAPSRPGATPHPCQPLTFLSCVLLPGRSAPAPLASAVPPLCLLLSAMNLLPWPLSVLYFSPYHHHCLAEQLSVSPPTHSRASALSPLPLMVWYPIQLCYPCLWENLWACSFLSLLEATASSTPSRPTQLTRPFCPSHLSCPVLPSGGSRRPDTSRPLPKPQGIALNRISVSFDCLQGGFRDANFISLGLGVGERLSVLYKTHPP